MQNNALEIAKNSIFYFSNMNHSYIYTKYINYILLLLNGFLKFGLNDDKAFLKSLFDSCISIMSKILCLSLIQMKESLLDPLVNFFIYSANIVSTIASNYSFNIDIVFNSRILFCLNKQLFTTLMEKAWNSILYANLHLLETIPPESSQIEELQSLIEPSNIFRIVLRSLTSDYCAPACHIMSLIIDSEGFIVETLEIKELCEEMSKSYHNLLFVPKREIMRLCFSILLQQGNQQDFVDFLVEKEIISDFPSILENVSDELVLKSIKALRAALDMQTWIPEKYKTLKEIIIYDYKDLLQDWSENSENEDISNKAAELFNQIL